MQALSRFYPELPPAPGRGRRVAFEYDRHGTLAYLAGYDVHRARLIGTVAAKTGIAPFTELVDKVMRTEPYASARRVFWLVDNGSSHNSVRSIQRMQTAWPTARLVHLPVHASWLNQVEIIFSVIQRKVIKPADFVDLNDLAQRLTAFEPRFNATVRPFNWRFTRADLNDLRKLIDAHRPAGPTQAAVGETLSHGHSARLDQDQPRSAAHATSP